MGYSKLTYAEFSAEPEFWVWEKGMEAPAWCAEVETAGGVPICAIDFYEDIFKEGDLEPSRVPEDYRSGEYGAIALEIRERMVKGELKSHGHRITVTDGIEELIALIDESDNFCLISPVSYAGRERKDANARYLHALCVEIDDVRKDGGIKELFYTFERKNRPIPRPTYIVCSGNGLHLYWAFERPIPLFKNIFEQLSAIKTYLTKNLWDKQISRAWRRIQYEPLCQAFRCVGTCGKDKRKIAMAFKVGDNITIEKLNGRLPADLQMKVIYKTNLTLAQASELYPDWYRRRVIEGQPRGHYNRHPGIYYNWIDKILEGAAVGHRYNCLENLCSLGVQCMIPPEQVEADCRRIAEYMESLTVDPTNHFTEYDIVCALKTYHDATEMAYRRKIEHISKKTGIPLIPAKRNGKKQADHIKIMNYIRDEVNGNREWHGRKPKGTVVAEWRESHPNGSKADCVRETGLSKPTVYKWWDQPGEVVSTNSPVLEITQEDAALISKYDADNQEVVILDEEDKHLLKKMRPYMPDRMGQLRVVPSDEHAAMLRIMQKYAELIKAEIK